MEKEINTPIQIITIHNHNIMDQIIQITKTIIKDINLMIKIIIILKVTHIEEGEEVEEEVIIKIRSMIIRKMLTSLLNK